MKKNLIFPEGSFFGKPFIPRLDQKKFIYEWYSYCPNCDRWRYAEALRGEATGGGKTTLLAGLAMLEFAGPPTIAAASPNIVVAASTRGQADELFRKVGQMAGGRNDTIREAPLCGLFDVFEFKVLFKDGRPGMIERVASESGANEGGFPSLFICDELHTWGSAGSKIADNKTVIEKSTTKRSDFRGRGRVMSITTAGFDRDNSLCGDMYKYGKQVEHDPELDPKFFFTWFEADENLDPENPDDRRIMVQQASPAAGVQWNIEDRVRAWNKPDMASHQWLRYYANRWVDVGEKSWLKDHPGAWSACKGEWESSNQNPFTIGVDMALYHDTLGVVRAERLPDERTAVTAKIWRADQVTGRIDHADVWRYILSIAKGEGFRGVVYDPR
ncbi:MAG TPA: terminase large subunit, partial [Terriglobia bacterium]|nr:terminase large subunit [Terriglobia bacterium]